jgi:predicted DsbA family dithiol-disulfide isomerase
METGRTSAGGSGSARAAEIRSPVRLVAYSDYLCPWCFNAVVRLQRLEAEDPAVTVEWRSYLLRPRPGVRRDLERFRAYTQSWLRPAGEEDAGRFQVWQSDAGPPSHSVPPHVVAKAALRLDRGAFLRLHEGLFRAYFAENRDVTDGTELRLLWLGAGLSEADFPTPDDPTLVREVLADHQEAVEMGATGVPSVRLAEADTVITGALPVETYQRWVSRTRERRAAGGSGP